MVHFMFERRGDVVRAIFVNEPFLSTGFEAVETDDDHNIQFRYHRFPNILALGIMLLEIELGLRIEDHYLEECYDGNGKLTVNANHVAAMRLFQEEHLWREQETFKPFKQLIGDCLISDVFRPYFGDQTRVRDALYKHVVGPLRELFEKAWDRPEETDVRPIHVQQVETFETASQAQSRTDSLPYFSAVTVSRGGVSAREPKYV